MDCIFCKIIKGDITCYKIYEDDDVLAMLDIANDVEGHTLVLPKKHVTDLNDSDEETFDKVMNVTKRISDHYLYLGFEGVNVVINSKSVAGQEVGHLHAHIFPRRSGDEVKLQLVKPDKNFSLEEVAKKLRLN